jgi:hypothetical protein
MASASRPAPLRADRHPGRPRPRRRLRLAVLESLNAQEIADPVVRIGWPDEFIEHGKPDALRAKYGLTAEAALELLLRRALLRRRFGSASRLFGHTRYVPLSFVTPAGTPLSHFGQVSFTSFRLLKQSRTSDSSRSHRTCRRAWSCARNVAAAFGHFTSSSSCFTYLHFG